MKNLRYYQQECVEALLHEINQGNNALASIACGGGKCEAAGTEIIMYDATVKVIEEIKVGDLLIGPDSLPRKVMLTSNGEGDMYQIQPLRGDSFVVNGNHILSLKRKKLEEKRISRNLPAYVNVSVADYLKKSGSWKEKYKLWRTGVDFQGSHDLDLDPYYLGLWLGDGTSAATSIATADCEIELYVRNYAESKGLITKKYDTPNNKSSVYYLTTPTKSRGKNPIKNALRKYGLLNNKHIPNEYKTASREVRLALLAGIVDSDGYLHHNGYDIVFKSKVLMDDVLFLARSLGFSAHMKPCRKKCCNTGKVGDYYRTAVCGEIIDIPTRLNRNIENVRPRSKRNRNNLLTAFSISPIGVGRYYGFELDGDGLYLHKDFTVTHNSSIIAELIRRLLELYPGENILNLVHVQELVAQNAEEICSRNLNTRVAIFCDSLKQKNWAKITVGSIKSIYKEVKAHKNFVFLVVDEVHMINTKEVGQYREFVSECKKHNTEVVLIGLTATAFRLDNGVIYGDDQLFPYICYKKSLIDLIKEGYLTPLRSLRSDETDTTGLKTLGGEWNRGQLSERMSAITLVKSHVTDILERTSEKNCNSVLIFAVDAKHAIALRHEFRSQGEHAEYVLSEVKLTSKAERKDIIDRFKSGRLRYLINVQIMSTGTNVPRIDCIVDMRLTKSKGLLLQFLGRGTRRFPGKEICWVLSYSGNFKYHGTIEDLETCNYGTKGGGKAPIKVCPGLKGHCLTEMHPTVRICPTCEYEFPEIQHNDKEADKEAYSGPISTLEGPKLTRREVTDVEYLPHVGKTGIPVLKASYYYEGMSLGQFPITGWITLEHRGSRREEAVEWWVKHTEGSELEAYTPLTVAEALELVDQLKVPSAIVSKKDGKYDVIVEYEFD